MTTFMCGGEGGTLASQRTFQHGVGISIHPLVSWNLATNRSNNEPKKLPSWLKMFSGQQSECFRMTKPWAKSYRAFIGRAETVCVQKAAYKHGPFILVLSDGLANIPADNCEKLVQGYAKKFTTAFDTVKQLDQILSKCIARRRSGKKNIVKSYLINVEIMLVHFGRVCIFCSSSPPFISLHLTRKCLYVYDK